MSELLAKNTPPFTSDFHYYADNQKAKCDNHYATPTIVQSTKKNAHTFCN